MSENPTENQIKWEYTFRPFTRFRRQAGQEFYVTTYEGKPVEADVGIGAHPEFPTEDVVRLIIYSDTEKKGFIGFQTLRGQPLHPHGGFIEPLKEGPGQKSMDPAKAPRLEDFVQRYRPLIVSLRPLMETFQDYLQPSS